VSVESKYPPDAAFLAEGGHTGALIAAHDWAATALGPIASWPQSLRTATAILLRSPVPMVMLWGEDGVMLYNDAYSVFAGGRHPHLLGSKVREGWPEVAEFNDNVMTVGLAGGTLAYKDQELTLYRTGRAEQVWMNLDYSPVLDEAGRPAGVLAVVIETTERVRAERELRTERDRNRGVLDNMGEAFVLLDHNFRIIDMNAEAMRLESRPRAEIIGKTHWEAHPDAAPELGDLYRVAMAERRSVALEHRYVWPDGRETWIDMRAYPVADGLAVFYRDITERKDAEAVLGESEARFRNMADNTPVMMWVTDPSGYCTYLNRRWYEFTGQAEAHGEGYGWLEAVHPEDRPLAESAFVSANAEQRDYRVEFRVRRADGAYRWAIDAAAARFAEDGTYLGYVGSVIDIDERREAELALLASTAQAEALAAEQAAILGQLAEGVIVTDPQGKITFVNEAAARLHGVARLDVEPDAYSDTYHLLTVDGEPYPSNDLPLARAVLKGETVADAAWRIRRPDGSEVLALGSAQPVTAPSGERIGAVLTLRDETERAAAEQALRESRDRLAEESRALEVLNRIGTLVAAELDVERLVQQVVDAGVTLTGARFGAFFYNVLDDQGASYMLYALSGAERSAFDGFGMPRATSVFAPTFRGEGVIRSDDILRDERYGKNAPHSGMPKGHLPVRSYLAVPVISRSGEVIGGLMFGHPEPGMFTERAERAMTGLAAQAAIGIDNARLFDAVQQANAELEARVRERTAELETAHEALRQSQKMEAVGQLTGGIAHDFNNMLAVVIGSLDLLGRRIGDADARARRYVDAASDGARRAALLTQRLLAFSRQQPLKPESIDANKLVAGMSELIRGSLGGDVRLETVLASGLWRTHADPNQLENVILNLAVNARDAMPDGGRLTIETQNAHLDARYVAAHLGTAPGQYVLVAVTDTGTGMPEEVIAKAFDPFFTTKEVGKGTGLGLSQVYGFVKQTGGHVKIYSERGQGTTVKVYLPRLLTEDPAIAGKDDLAEMPLGEAQEVVLVVEDEPAVRQFSVDALSELGYRVLEADGAAAALRLLDSHPEIALLFTDVVMPEVNGAKLAMEARRLRPDLRILFTTGYTRNAVVHNGVLDPGVELIGKPFSIEELAAKVRDVLDAPGAAALD
jgi:PAS domain S-box-containing protein